LILLAAALEGRDTKKCVDETGTVVDPGYCQGTIRRSHTTDIAGTAAEAAYRSGAVLTLPLNVAFLALPAVNVLTAVEAVTEPASSAAA